MTLGEAADDLFHIDDLPESFFDLEHGHPHRAVEVFGNICVWCGVLAGTTNGDAAATWAAAPVAERLKEAQRIADSVKEV